MNLSIKRNRSVLADVCSVLREMQSPSRGYPARASVGQQEEEKVSKETEEEPR